jgi:glutathione S-transferase
MSNPTLYGTAMSTYVRTARLALEEKGVPYDMVDVNIFEEKNKEPEYIARHPFAKVPAFEHDGFALIEDGAIVRYVDNAFDGPALQPSDVKAQAEMDKWISLYDSYIFPTMIGKLVWQRVVEPMLGGAPDEDIITGCLDEVERQMGLIDAALSAGGGWLAGGQCTLAEFYFIPALTYMELTPEGKASIERHANVSSWWEKLKGRKSVQDTHPL